MKAHITIPAIAALALLAANAASASTPSGNAPRSAKIQTSTDDSVFTMARQKYDLRADVNSHDVDAQSRSGGVIFVRDEEK